METFRKISNIKGQNSAGEKESLIMKLLFDSKGEEGKYIIRWIQKNLKIGAAEASMQSALVRCFIIKNNVNEKDQKANCSLSSISDIDKKVQ